MTINDLIRELSAIRAVNGGNCEIFDTDGNEIMSVTFDHDTKEANIESLF